MSATSTDTATRSPGQSDDPVGTSAWLTSVGLALAVLTVGVAEAARGQSDQWVVILGIAVAVLLARAAPAAALGLVWVVGALQVLLGMPVMATEAAVAVVAYACARWGRVPTVVASGLSIPAATGLSVLLILRGSYGLFLDVGTLREIVDGANRLGDTLLVGAAILGTLVLALPWLAGVTVRATVRARTSRVGQAAAEADTALAQREAAQAQDIATLRADQARLAHDVHDVVGHSLAVILAQAESAQYLPDDDPARLKTTLATIATSARSSLQDVRHVLGSAPGSPATPSRDGVEGLLDGVRATGREVTLDDVGTPRPLPPELDVVAHRVLQEMLTNAVKHGVRTQPVHIERHWPAGGLERDLRLEVSNADAAAQQETQPIVVDASASGTAASGTSASGTAASGTATPGQGVPGMRSRLESVGGRLDVRRRAGTFTATAWVPVSGRDADG